MDHTRRDVTELWRWVVLAVLGGALAAGGLLIWSGGPDPANLAGALEPRYAELPGGFDPIPEFDRTARELEFRGAECADDTAAGAYRLVRVCPG